MAKTTKKATAATSYDVATLSSKSATELMKLAADLRAEMLNHAVAVSAVAHHERLAARRNRARVLTQLTAATKVAATQAATPAQ